MTNFSVVVIARNEEQTLPRLLESLAGFREQGGEIVVLDTGSTDRTAQIAAAAGCKVFEAGDTFALTLSREDADRINSQLVARGEGPIVEAGQRIFDYSAARNAAAVYATKDFVAMPDCDEAYTKLDLAGIDEALAADASQLEYPFVYAHDADGRPMIEFTHSKFYDRRKLRWTGIIHEVLTPIDGAATKRVFTHAVKLEHWQNAETNRGGYLTGLAYDVLRDPSNDRNSHYFGRELFYRGFYRSAIRELERHLEMGGWVAERAQSLVYIGDSYAALGDFESAIYAWTKAFNLDPQRREGAMRVAEHFYRLRMPDHVAAWVAAALQGKGADFYGNYQPYYQGVPHQLMYWAAWQRGDVGLSREHYDLAAAYDPFNPQILHDRRFYHPLPKVSFVIPTLGRPEGLKRCLDSIAALNYPQEQIETIVIEDEPRLGVPKRVNEGVAKATGEWIVYASNDVEFLPDSLILALRMAQDNAKGFVAFNTGAVSPDEGNVCEHFMIHRKLVEYLKGEVFDPEFRHVGVDNLLWAKMKRLGHALRCDRAIVNHYHFSRTGEEMDAVAKLAWDPESVAADRALLARKLDELSKQTTL